MSNAPAFLYSNVMDSLSNELNGVRYTFPASLIVAGDAGVATEVDAIGVSMPDSDGIIFLYSGTSSSGPWTLVGAGGAYKMRNALRLFDAPVTSRHWLVQASGFTSAAVIKVGKAVRIDQNNYQGTSPPVYNQSVSLKPSGLNKGQWLGRQSYGRTATASYSFDHITSAWWRANAIDLVEALRDGKGVFYAWRPDKYPQDVLYGHLSGPVRISNTGTKSFVGGEIQISGVYDGNFDSLADYSVTVPS